MFDPSTDYLIFDGTENVTLERGELEIPHAIREPLSKSEIANMGSVALENETCAFHLPRPEMFVDGDEVKVRTGDVLTDHYGVPWTVMSYSYAELIQQWRVACVRARS